MQWYKLDNIGTYYAAQAMKTGQTGFRFSATLRDTIEKEPLQQALNYLLTLYPSFNMCLRNGIFWHYLEQRDEGIAVSKEQLPINFDLHVKAGAPLIRVSYYQKRINVEISHMISDGRGALQFFEDLIVLYCNKRYKTSAELPNAFQSHLSEKAEDSYRAHYEKHPAQTSQTKKGKRRPYRLRFTRSPDAIAYYEMHVSAGNFIRQAKEWEVSVTALLGAIVVRAIMNTMKSPTKKLIRIGIPVDLRSFKGSKTARNYFGLTSVEYIPRNLTASLKDIAQSISPQIRQRTRPENVLRRTNNMLKLERSAFVSYIASPLKDFVLRIAQKFTDIDVTTTVSNLGIMRLPDDVRGFVENANISTSSNDCNFTSITLGDDLSITMSSTYITPVIAQCVFEELLNLGIDVHVNATKSLTLSEDLEQAHKKHRFSYSSDDVFPHQELMKQRFVSVVALTWITWAIFLALWIVSLSVALPLFIPLLSSFCLWAAYLFSRNVIRRSLSFVRAESRCYLVLIALFFIWFITTGFMPVLTIALPVACISGIAFDIIVLLVLRASFIQQYTKYILWTALIGCVPVFLVLVGIAPFNVLSLVSAGLAVLLIILSVALNYRQLKEEFKKLFTP